MLSFERCRICKQERQLQLAELLLKKGGNLAFSKNLIG